MRIYHGDVDGQTVRRINTVWVGCAHKRTHCNTNCIIAVGAQQPSSCGCSIDLERDVMFSLVLTDSQLVMLPNAFPVGVPGSSPHSLTEAFISL